MATTRLRKAFRYPDDSDEELPEGIDEQEQEKLITELQTEDVAKTEFYKKAFLALPALSLILYLRPLFASSSFAEFLTAVLAVTSLAASAYTLYFIPLGNPPSSSFLPARAQVSSGSAVRRGYEMALRTLGTGGVDDGPVEKFLPLLNLALCLVVWLKSRTAKDEVAGWEGGLPTLVFVLVFLVRSQLAPIDVAGLERLRYGYKGA
ncbi:hypothetical protein BFW01_g8314 [Lasiodiplodia theobromae]|uniref:Uncharacterized protein n=1 Tax=Lasiodiplodia theobromae TaxID=45133 RepID=A0A5N5DDD3_9PEZI|nr:hypothetical protein DBV05_g6220 [Lasiodiplodia theobromae]KAF9637418.1 hypothetical protein BFW01_g8314 [Lasiodiplodia theobromae]